MKFGSKMLKSKVRPALQSANTQRNRNKNTSLFPMW